MVEDSTERNLHLSCTMQSTAQQKEEELVSQLTAEQQQREEHKATVQELIDYLEQVIGESADHHREAIDHAHGKLAALKDEHGQRHGSLEDRLEYLEDSVGSPEERPWDFMQQN